MIPFKLLSVVSALRDVNPPLSPVEIPSALRLYRESAMDEVTGSSVTLNGSARYENGRFFTPAGRANNIEFGYINVAEGEDFTFELKFNIISVGGSGGLLLGAWNAGGGTNNAWTLTVTTDRRITNTITNNGQNYHSSIQSEPNTITFGVDSHVALERKDGVIHIRLNGKSVASGNYNGAIYQTTLPVATVWSDVNGWVNGTRWDIRLVKSAMYGADFTPAALPPFSRGKYTTEVAEDIILQYTGRDGAREEAKNRTATLVNASVINGRIVSTSNVNSYYSFPSEYFGEGDFTVECDIVITTIQSFGAVLVGQWRAGGNADQNNRWAMFINSSRVLSFTAARSAEANDYVTVSANAPLAYNTDNRIIIERVGDTTTIWLNGKAVLVSSLINFPLRTTTSGYHIRSLSAQNAYAFAGRITNIRVADRAMYNGNVKSIGSSFPEMP